MSQPAPQPVRAATAAFIGTMIEWYDFYIYATAAALVFGTLFSLPTASSSAPWPPSAPSPWASSPARSGD